MEKSVTDTKCCAPPSALLSPSESLWLRQGTFRLRNCYSFISFIYGARTFASTRHVREELSSLNSLDNFSDEELMLRESGMYSCMLEMTIN